MRYFPLTEKFICLQEIQWTMHSLRRDLCKYWLITYFDLTSNYCAFGLTSQIHLDLWPDSREKILRKIPSFLISKIIDLRDFGKLESFNWIRQYKFPLSKHTIDRQVKWGVLCKKKEGSQVLVGIADVFIPTAKGAIDDYQIYPSHYPNSMFM